MGEKESQEMGPTSACFLQNSYGQSLKTKLTNQGVLCSIEVM